MNSAQEEGWIGRRVGAMIRRSVRKSFKGVYLHDDSFKPDPDAGPYVFAVNHHGWHDGYLMFHLITHLGIRCLDWIQEFDSFPLFAKVGGMPFPADRPEVRTATIRRTIRLMREEKRSLVLFPEGVLHYPPEILPFGATLRFVAEHANATVIPVAIRYEMAIHERPEAFIRIGASVSADVCRESLVDHLVCLTRDTRGNRDRFTLLARGTDSVNERWDMRRIPKRK